MIPPPEKERGAAKNFGGGLEGVPAQVASVSVQWNRRLVEVGEASAPGVIFNLNSVLALENGVGMLSGALSGYAPELGADGMV
jgi:hypothetical protein